MFSFTQLNVLLGWLFHTLVPSQRRFIGVGRVITRHNSCDDVDVSCERSKGLHITFNRKPKGCSRIHYISRSLLFFGQSLLSSIFFHIAMSYAFLFVATPVGFDYLTLCAFAPATFIRDLIFVFAFAITRDYYLLVTWLRVVRSRTVIFSQSSR